MGMSTFAAAQEAKRINPPVVPHGRLRLPRGYAQVEWLGVGVIPWFVAAVTALAGACALAVLIAAMRAAPTFENWMAAGIAALAMVAMIWEAWPAALLVPCA
jgi:hypothetical protein